MQGRKFSREFKLEAVRLVKDRGVAVAQAARDLDLHENVLRKWVRETSVDPQHAFPGHGQMKPEQIEIDRLRKEVAKLKAERDILKNRPGSRPVRPVETPRANLRSCEGSGRQLIGGFDTVKKRGPWVHAHLRVVTPVVRAVLIRKMKDWHTHALRPERRRCHDEDDNRWPLGHEAGQYRRGSSRHRINDAHGRGRP